MKYYNNDLPSSINIIIGKSGDGKRYQKKLRLRHQIKELVGIIFLYALIVITVILLSERIG